MPEAIPASLRAMKAPYLHEYFSPWCIHVETFRAAVERVRGMNLSLHLDQQRTRKRRRAGAKAGMESDERNANIVRSAAAGRASRSYEYSVNGNGTAIVDISGTLMKAESSLDSSTSTVLLRGTVRRMRTDADVKRVMFRCDSPGGSAAGTQDLADDVAALVSEKPCYGYIEDLGCSALYWVASQCNQIYTNRTGIVGSIGTYATLYDYSGWAAMQGIKVYVIAAQPTPDSPPAPLKGAGAEGSVITPAQLAEWQQLVNALNDQFLAAVSTGRRMGMDKVVNLATGGVFVGAAAKSAGLVDDVCSFDEAMSQLESVGTVSPARKGARSEAEPVIIETEIPPGAGSSDAPIQKPAPAAASAEPITGDPTMSATTPTATPAAPASEVAKPNAASEPKPASISELKAAFPANPAFALDAAEKALTMTEAKAAYADVLAKENDELKAKVAAQPEPGAKRPGVAALKNGGSETRPGSDAVAASGQHAFEEIVEKKVAAGMARDRAVMKTAAEQPDLHADYREFCKNRQR